MFKMSEPNAGRARALAPVQHCLNGGHQHQHQCNYNLHQYQQAVHQHHQHYVQASNSGQHSNLNPIQASTIHAPVQNQTEYYPSELQAAAAAAAAAAASATYNQSDQTLAQARVEPSGVGYRRAPEQHQVGYYNQPAASYHNHHHHHHQQNELYYHGESYYLLESGTSATYQQYSNEYSKQQDYYTGDGLNQPQQQLRRTSSAVLEASQAEQPNLYIAEQPNLYIAEQPDLYIAEQQQQQQQQQQQHQTASTFNLQTACNQLWSVKTTSASPVKWERPAVGTTISVGDTNQFLSQKAPLSCSLSRLQQHPRRAANQMAHVKRGPKSGEGVACHNLTPAGRATSRPGARAPVYLGAKRGAKATAGCAENSAGEPTRRASQLCTNNGTSSKRIRTSASGTNKEGVTAATGPATNRVVIPRRKNVTRSTTIIMKLWLRVRCRNPYPNRAEKSLLVRSSSMTNTQVSTWLANARRRLKKEGKFYEWMNHRPPQQQRRTANELTMDKMLADQQTERPPSACSASSSTASMSSGSSSSSLDALVSTASATIANAPDEVKTFVTSLIKTATHRKRRPEQIGSSSVVSPSPSASSSSSSGSALSSALSRSRASSSSSSFQASAQLASGQPASKASDKLTQNGQAADGRIVALNQSSRCVTATACSNRLQPQEQHQQHQQHQPKL